MERADDSREEAAGILVVDDDAPLRERLVEALRRRGHPCGGVGGLTEARAWVEARGAPRFAIVDLRLPDGSGLEVLRFLRAQAPGTRVLVFTGFGTIATALEAMRLGAHHYLTKPADLDEILAGLERASGERAAPAEAVPSLEQVEREHVERVLAACEGNLTRAAKVLGLHRRSLQRKLARRAF